ncbi:anion exchange protein 2-like [Oopsacas minuta]|uniref:Anion exchange protein 2-like n=1 Tax=Oopsacas minuta TaxID=111878 RepID=A0AAV7JV79_9METZ|nr:anion exchange protein 2-like [Oopsacas minuta]
MDHHGHYHRKFLFGKHRNKRLDEERSPNGSYASSQRVEEAEDYDVEKNSPPSSISKMRRINRGNNALTTHKVFIELEELDQDATHDVGWKETARWIKFEEDVNKVKGGFDKPRVATLSFHSLSDVKKGIQTGCVILDLEASSLPQVSFKVVDKLIHAGKLDMLNREDVLKALLLRHHHEHHHSLWEDIKNSFHLHYHSRSHSTSQSIDNQSPYEQPRNFRGLLTRAKAFSIDDRDVPGSYEMRNKRSYLTRSKAVSIDEIPEINLSKYTPELDKAITMTDEDDASHHSLVLDSSTEATAVLVGPLESLEEPLLAFVRLKEATKLGNLLEVNLPVRFLFLLLGPINCELNYHEIGRSIATLMSNQDFLDSLYTMKTESELLTAIDSFLDESIVVPPGDWNFSQAEKPMIDNFELPEGINTEFYLKPNLIPFSGLLHDIKNVYNPCRYWSDFRDGFNFQCLWVICFVFFACLGPTLVFGGLYGEKTQQQIGEIESLLASLVFGVIFSLFSGQPIMILGASGPLLIFDEIIFSFSENILQGHFLIFRAWIGVWLAIFLVLVVALQGSFLVRFFTRFSEEIIASLTVWIFFIEAILYVRHLIQCYPISDYCNDHHPKNYSSQSNQTNYHYGANISNESTQIGVESCHYSDVNPCESKLLVSNTALFSILLIIGTFGFLLAIRHFRHSKFFRRVVRNRISDFNILISLTVFTIIYLCVKSTIYVETVSISKEILHTSTSRDWFINPFGNLLPFYWCILAFIPAAFLCILIVMETQLTNLLIAKKHHCLQKPLGFHLDLLLVALFSLVSGFFGLPWFCGAAMRSLQHVQSLAVYSNRDTPGVVPHIIGIREQRITSLSIHILIGICIPLLWVAKVHLGVSLPVAVLFGAIIYLAYISWKSLQFVVRIKLLFMRSKHHPNTVYVKNVRPYHMHGFTIIQILCFLVILGFKLGPAVYYTPLFFPILCVLLVPFRKICSIFFTREEMEALDHEDDNPKDLGENDELSEYETTHIPI